MPVPDFSPGEVLTAAAMDQVGLWRLGGGTFSVGTSGQSFTAFTSDYDNYQIVFSDVVCSSGLASLLFRFSASGTPSTTGYYWAGSYESYATSPTRTNFGGANGPYGMYLLDASTSYTIGTTSIVQAPNKAQWTMYRWQGTLQDNSVQGNGVHKVNTAYDSFFLYTNQFTISGKYDIYGYRK